MRKRLEAEQLAALGEAMEKEFDRLVERLPARSIARRGRRRARRRRLTRAPGHPRASAGRSTRPPRARGPRRAPSRPAAPRHGRRWPSGISALEPSSPPPPAAACPRHRAHPPRQPHLAEHHQVGRRLSSTTLDATAHATAEVVGGLLDRRAPATDTNTSRSRRDPARCPSTAARMDKRVGSMPVATRRGEASRSATSACTQQERPRAVGRRHHHRPARHVLRRSARKRADGSATS